MPPIKVEIAIVVSAIPVGPRKADLKDQPFALHVSAAYKTPPPTPMENLENVLRPWLSNWDFKRAVVKVEDTAGVISELDGKKIETLRKPSSIPENLATLRGQVTDKTKDNTWNPASITQPKNGNQTAQPRLIEAVHALSLYPGSIPQDSRLLNYSSADGWPAGPKRLIAAPEFSFVLRLAAGNVTVKCKPTALMNLDDWDQGWAYELSKEDGTPVDLGDLDLKILAYSKPLNVAKTNGVFFFDGEELAGDATLGPNFKDFWFRIQVGDPWINRIKDLEQFVTNLNERMMQARSTLDDADPAMLEGWDDLRLMALALYGQWDRPAVINDCIIEPNDDKRLIELLTAQLSLTAPEATALNDRLTTFHNKLAEQFDPADLPMTQAKRADRRKLWLRVFQKAFNDPDLTVQTLLQRAVDSPVDFDLLLFHQWDFAVEEFAPDAATDTLLLKWKTKFSPLIREWMSRISEDKSIKGVEAPLSLFLEAQPEKEPEKMNYGVRTLRKKYWLCVSQDLLKEPASERVTQKLAAQFKNLRTRLDIKLSAKFFPQLASENVLGAAVWKKLWDNWAGDGLGNEGYIARYLKRIVPPPETEEKPGGLTIVFDKPSPRGQQPPKEEQSAWRKLGGVGVLVREQRANPKEGWRVATAATLNLRGVHIIRVFKKGKRELELTVDVHPKAREEKYHLSVGGEVFPEVFAVTRGSASTKTDPVKVAPDNLPPGATFQTLTITRTDKDWDDAALRQVSFDKLLTDAALIPMRVPFQKGVRQPFVTYNQNSLIASSHLNKAVGSDFETSDKRPVELDDALYEYGPAQNGKATNDLVPLKFGKTYEMAAFMIDTAGGLPSELSDGVPWVFKETGFDMPTGHPVIQEFPYFRKVPVGQVRVSHLNDKGVAISWPEWPENISPLAGETIPVNKKIDAEPTDDPEKRKRQSQLVLLFGDQPATNKFLFGVKPPTVDRDVLERWENTADAATKERLLETIKQYYNRLTKRKGDISVNLQNRKDEDVVLDDPAVTRFLFILESYDFEESDEKKKWKVESFCVSDIRRDAAVKDLTYYQQDWKKVFCQRGAAFEVRESGADIQVTVRESEASVAKLRVFGLVPPDFIKPGANAKFDAGFFDAASEDPLEVFKFLEDFSRYQYRTKALEDGIKTVRSQFKCLKPFSFMLETPNAEMPDARDLWLNLMLRTSGAGRDVVQLFLQQPSSLRAQFRNIVRCDLLKQRWRWQGRPLDQQSVGKLKTEWTATDGVVRDEKLNEVIGWELSAFAEMHDIFDTLTIPLPFKFQSAESLYTDDYQKDLPAHYLRYALRAYSRYEGLFAPNKALPVVSKQPYTKPFDDSDLSDAGLTSLIPKLRDGQDPLATFLRTQLQQDTRDLLNKPSPPLNELRPRLLRDLKKLITGPSIYTPERFPEATLSPETIGLRKQQPTGEGLLRLNRWLLEDAFHAELVSHRDVLSGLGWRRALLRYRGPKPTKPHIKAIVPLTQAYTLADGRDLVSPLMAVLEETMFSQCGITEWIECRVEKAELYEGATELVCKAGDPRKTFHQAGHDPILSAENAACDLPDASKVTLRLTPEGPFGHTFDTGARLSLFGDSSFLIRPYEKAVDWDFAKVSFRRLSGNESPEDVGEKTDWTIPIWLYFLPASRFNIADWDNDVSLVWDQAAKRLTLAPHDTKVFQPLAKQKVFKYCLILTRTVRDFRGEGQHEIYDNYARLEFTGDASGLKKDFSEALPAGTEYVARLVEVQMTRKKPGDQFDELPDKGKDFWNQLLEVELSDDKDSTNARFRITRVSPPKRFRTGP